MTTYNISRDNLKESNYLSAIKNSSNNFKPTSADDKKLLGYTAEILLEIILNKDKQPQ